MKYVCILFFIQISLASFGQNAAPFQRNSKWPTKSIKVCFENASSQNAVERRWIKEAVEETWQKHCGLTFIDWCQCDNNLYNIRVLIKNDDTTRPYARALGSLNDGLKNGIVLNKQWVSIGCGDLMHKDEDCFKAVAIHEFGHAIGFSHEHANPNCCRRGDMGGTDVIDPRSDDWIVNEVCDESSVMSYCNPKYSNHGSLSPNDISMIQRIYGLPFKSDNSVVIRDNFSKASSVFKNFNTDSIYSSYISDHNSYIFKLKPVWGFTWVPIPEQVSEAFSAYTETTLEFDYKVVSSVEHDNKTNKIIKSSSYHFGLMFDLHDVGVTQSCIGGNFYVLSIFNDLNRNIIWSGVDQRTNCQNNSTWNDTIGNIRSINSNVDYNHIKVLRSGKEYKVYINNTLTSNFTYKGYLNFEKFYWSAGESEIKNLKVTKK